MKKLKYISPAEAATRLNISRQRVHVLIRSGRIRAINPVARVWLIDPVSVDAFRPMASHRPKKQKPPEP